jgi:membrane protein
MRVQEKLRNLWRLLMEAATWWAKDNTFQLGAAVAFYTIFAISPMFLIVTSIAGLVSLLLSAALSALGTYFSGVVPGFDALWQLAAAVAAFLITAALFAMIFKYLPDIRIQWREVAVGALVTAALFTGGKFLIGFYLGRSAVASTYGAAGSLVVVLLWVYYSSLILFYGAEITRVHARHSGAHVEPAPHADWTERATLQDI